MLDKILSSYLSNSRQHNPHAPFNPSIGRRNSYTAPYLATQLTLEDYGRKTHLKERRHGLVGTPDLHLEEGGLGAVATLLGTLHLGLGGVGPVRGAYLVLFGLALEVRARVHGVCDGVDVWAGPALEAVVAAAGADGEEGAVIGADWES